MEQREIKFRAFLKTGVYAGIMVYQNGPNADGDIGWIGLTEGGYKIYFDFEDIMDNKLTVPMQYIGRKDKNGVEIYEGDIIKSNVQTITIEWKGEMWTEEGFITGFSELWESANCYEVIGNIYENSDIMEKK